jgi:hypothetical protein
MSDIHLNFGLTEEEHEFATEVKKDMKSSNWKKCFMELIEKEKERRNL